MKDVNKINQNSGITDIKTSYSEYILSPFLLFLLEEYTK